MVKTQVQIPDALFEKAKQVAASKEWSFAEIVRRGLEYMTETNPACRQPAKKWKLPPPARLGIPLLPEEQWTEAAHNFDR